MTEKISAGYFDTNRQSPIYTGDVYREDGCICPYHKVYKDDEKGFMIEHVGSNEKFLFQSGVKSLLNYHYMGNIYDTPSLESEIKANTVGYQEINKATEETVGAEISEDVKEFLEGNTDELPEGTEVISEAEAEELEKQAKEIEETVETTTETETEPESDTVETQSEETVEETEPEADAVVSTEATTGEKEEKSNVVPLVVASSKEEKDLLEKKNDYKNHIEKLKRKNDELETEAVKFDNLASVLTFEPFVELKMLVSSAVQDYAKKQEIKDCKKHLKNYEAIDSMEKLLYDYKELAEKNRANIELNNKDIDNYEIKLTEIEDKLKNLQRQLPLGV